ncbi:MAG TPA: M28 family metallopeptidase, partial [Thermoanaerobaculia bacterium]|nr:M28 family metallopeptidase [Thermoanaerobaculia bacterium]
MAALARPEFLVEIEASAVWTRIESMRPIQTPCLIAIFALFLSPPVLPQEPLPDAEAAMAGIRPQAIRAHMRFLADDLLEGRGTGTRGYELAAKYVASAFEGLGLEPAGKGDSYFQPVPLLRMTMESSKSVLSFTRNGQKTTLEYGKDYLNDYLFETEQSLTAPLVFAGFGVTAPELQRDAYAGVDARGKIVALLLGSPPTFSADQKAYYSDRRVRAANALAHGAVGLLSIRTPEFDKRLPWRMAVGRAKAPNLTWTDEAGTPRFRPELRGRAMLSDEGTAKLFAGAPHSLAEVLEAAAAGRTLSFALPVQASFRTVSRRERTESPNVAAVLRGSDPKLRDEYIVVSAHLDHIGVGEPVNGDSINNGAYDNASGIAVLLEMANAFTRLPTPPRRSVLFLAVTAEEMGLQGSDYFARNPTVPIDRIVANVNLDMFLMLYPLKDVVAFAAEHTSLGPTLEKAAGRLGVTVSPDPIPDEVFLTRSDQYSFIQRGVPAIILSSGEQTTDPAIDAAAVSAQ